MNDQWTTQTRHARNSRRVPGAFNPAEWQTLHNFSQSYHPGHEFFTSAEVGHLHFMRWLHQTGRSAS